MNLLDLIVHLADPRPREAFFLDHGVDTASEHLSIYMRGAPGLQTEIAMLGVEETDEEMDYHQDGVHWVNFMPLYMVEEMVEDGAAAHASPVEIAIRVLEYARDDA
ncbi:hypothetical protein GCM10027272_23840 [Hymenobacter frigidus]|jgi:hypothetical protein